MSSPKLNRKTQRPKYQRIYPHTEARRHEILRILKENAGLPVIDLRQRLGVDKYAINAAIEWLVAEGYNILSLAKGYILLDGTLAETRIMRRMSKLEEMVSSLTQNRSSFVPGKSVTGNGTVKPGAGRPKVSAPDDTAPLVEVIMTANLIGKPFTKTGSRGVYVRREELPERFRIGRNRIEELITELMQAGAIELGQGGALTVPKIVPGN